jgi:hypothetical protein
MSVATTRAVIERFLKSATPEALAIKGAWGSGKTYTWKKIVQHHRDQLATPSYCYVSLFGISSLRELRVALVSKTLPRSQIGESLDVTNARKNWKDVTKRITRAAAGFQSILEGLPFGKHVSIGVDLIAPSLVKNTTICFDDFERLGSGIRPEDLLGFISELKEERHCKVALIFNESKLADEGSVYRRYREKVIDIEVTFSPSVDEACAIAFADARHRGALASYAASLGIKNIRVLRKISRYAELVQTALGSMHAGVMAAAIPTVVLLTWASFDTDDDKPSVDFIRRWNFGWGSRERGNAPPEETRWSAVLNRYGMTHFDDFDAAILNVISRGYVEESGLVEEARKIEEKIRAGEADSEFTAAWRLFHDSFADNENEVVANLERGFRQGIRQVSPSNLSGTVVLLRELGRAQLADDLIEEYVRVRGNENGLFDLAAYPFADQVGDATVRRRFDEQHALTYHTPTLIDSLSAIALRNGWSKEQMQTVSDATEENFYQLFRQPHGSNLHKIIGACLMFNQAPHEHVCQRATAALRRIGQENRINGVRVRRYGVQMD